ncbi:hypothetical protein L1887_20089 [Cichorium endivia]|nr:hypothetical protein L1887_20089 [Cichorium endivia]
MDPRYEVLFDSSSSSEYESWLLEATVQGASLLRQAAQITADDAESSQNERPLTRRAAINRDREAAHDLLVRDYLAEHQLYSTYQFRRRFRMNKALFLRIVRDVSEVNPILRLQYDGRNKRGFTAEQKCTAAIRQIATGTAFDLWDEYLKMSERTVRESVYEFSSTIIHVYGKRYLRKPTPNDIQTLYAAHESKHGFPGMLGSVDCMHWEWAACPNAWRGQFTRGDHRHPSIILEAVASHDLWIWHAFFGVSGANNDLNVLDQSLIFNDIYRGVTPFCPFQVNGAYYKHGYYLADGIYRDYAVFVKSFTCPMDPKRKMFKVAQEAARKDVERAFGVLRQRFHMIKYPSRAWDPRRIRDLMYACIILHNMILEDEGKAICTYDPDEVLPTYEPLPIGSAAYLENRNEVQSKEIHNNLRADLVEHIYRARVEPGPVPDIEEEEWE